MTDESETDHRSELWAGIAPSMLVAAADLADFRIPGGPNSRLAHWEPREPTLRWFRSYLQLAADSMSPDERTILAHVSNIGLGNPVTVVTATNPMEPTKTELNLDYLYAAEETAFLQRGLQSVGGQPAIRYVIELGAGFGRTAHVILSAFENIQLYTIVDLPETLSLSRIYLAHVLPTTLFEKLQFVNAEDIGSLFPPDQRLADLAIQIDGLQEMDESTIDHYFERVFTKVRFVFLSNPVGKYLPQAAGIQGVPPQVIEQVLNLGRCHVVLDPWNATDLEAARPAYLSAYTPEGYEILLDEASRLRPLYQHVLFQRH